MVSIAASQVVDLGLILDQCTVSTGCLMLGSVADTFPTVFSGAIHKCEKLYQTCEQTKKKCIA